MQIGMAESCTTLASHECNSCVVAHILQRQVFVMLSFT